MVIGGLGYFPGAVVGGIVVGEILSLTTLFDPAYSQAAIYAVMTLVLIVPPRGLFGTWGAPDGQAPGGRLLRRWLPELAMAAALVLLPFVFDRWLGSVDLFTRILICGVFGLGFDLLFGRAGLLSFGQGAFYGTGGFVTAYLLTSGTLNDVWLAIAAGIAAAAAFSIVVGVLALRRVGIYFAMITLAFGELSYFLENSPLARWTGGENGLPACRHRACSSAASIIPRRELAELSAGRRLFLLRVRAGALYRPLAGRRGADRDRPNPQRTAALGHDVQGYKLAAFVLAAVYAGAGGVLLGIFQSYMPPDAFALETSGQLVIQTVIGGAGTLIGPAVGAAIWLTLRDLLQQIPASPTCGSSSSASSSWSWSPSCRTAWSAPSPG